MRGFGKMAISRDIGWPLLVDGEVSGEKPGVHIAVPHQGSLDAP
jgi:hypothetical protein